MALLLEQPTDFSDDVKSSYWKITDTNIDWLNQRYILKVSGFIDEDSRRANKSPIKIISYSYPGTFSPSTDPFPFSFEDNIVEKSYEILKTKPEWENAQDV